MTWRQAAGGALVLALALSIAARAQGTTGPDALVLRIAEDVLQAVKDDRDLRSVNLPQVMALVDRQIMPHVDMARFTALAMGRHWRQASPEQQRALEAEFKTLIVRSYAGALAQVSATQTVELRPLRAPPGEADVVVSTRIRGGPGEPVAIDYRLHAGAAGWQIYDVSFLGIWMAENYRNSFANEIGASGIDGLIAKLKSRNQSKGS